MTKREFINNLGLVKGDHVTVFDGCKAFERVVYSNKYGDEFVFYGNDLCRIARYRWGDAWITSAYGWYK